MSYYNDMGCFYAPRLIDPLPMTFPVRCQCGAIYDVGRVTVTARYADCSVWTTPCCGRSEDDRPWVRRYSELTPDEADRLNLRKRRTADAAEQPKKGAK